MVNPSTSLAVQKTHQVALVNLTESALPSGRYGSATIASCLSGWPEDKPLLMNARSAEGGATTYGQVRAFIRNGEGDLRRLGVRPGEVVAYGAPPGGGAAAALAFLSVGAQTCAAPLAPVSCLLPSTF